MSYNMTDIRFCHTIFSDHSIFFDKTGYKCCCMTKADKKLDLCKRLYDKTGYLYFSDKDYLIMINYWYDQIRDCDTVLMV